MPISADSTGLYIVKETVSGETPASPVWLQFPPVSESVATNATTTISNTLNATRQVLDSILTGMDISGSVEIELARTPAMDLILESVMASAWDVTGDPNYTMSVGLDQVTFSLMKRWPRPGSPGDYIYNIYTGCTADTLSVTMTAGSEVTASVGLIGKGVDAALNTTEPVGSTYPALTDFNVLRAPGVKGITLDNEAGTLAPLITDSCTTDITLNVTNNGRGIQCLGTLGNKETVLGRFESSVDMTIFFSDNNIMEDFLKQSAMNVTFTIGDADTDNHYKFTLPKGKLSSETVVAGGTNTDVVNALTFQGLVDTTAVPPTTVKIDTLAVGASAPKFVSGLIADGAATDVVVTFSEPVAIGNSTGVTINVDGAPANISSQVAAASDVTFTLDTPVTVGQIVTFQVDATNTITDTTDGLPMSAMDKAESLSNNVA